MKTLRKIVLIIGLMSLPLVTTSCTTVMERETRPKGSLPVITHSFASKIVSHGDMWKIYLEANDPDGDMWNFAYTLGRDGYRRRVNHLYIWRNNRTKMLGYIDVFIAPGETAQNEWANLTLTLHIRDRGGNMSNEVVFPVALSRGVQQTAPSPPFNIDGLKGLATIWYKPKVPRGDL
jgi:hypothetical protein